jgi:DNA polymerase-3 subunit chi
VVRAGSPERVAALDAHLWAYRDDSFLPHGTAADDHSSEQPIFLTADQTCPNHAQFLFLVDGAEGGGFEAYQRCIDLFDGRDEASVAAARERWRAAKAQGFELAYWQQDETGKWERKN